MERSSWAGPAAGLATLDLKSASFRRASTGSTACQSIYSPRNTGSVASTPRGPVPVRSSALYREMQRELHMIESLEALGRSGQHLDMQQRMRIANKSRVSAGARKPTLYDCVRVGCLRLLKFRPGGNLSCPTVMTCVSHTSHPRPGLSPPHNADSPRTGGDVDQTRLVEMMKQTSRSCSRQRAFTAAAPIGLEAAAAASPA